jgi:hypothetical protein
VYEKNRNNDRIQFRSRCLLIINELKHTCLVTNMSTTEALVEISALYRNSIKVGDCGTVKVLLHLAVTYPCKVVSIDDNVIRLNFLNQ